MPKNRNQKPAVQAVDKPTLIGSWHGKDAWRLGGRIAGSVLVVSLVYLILGLMLSFDSLWLRSMLAAALVAAATAYLYGTGLRQGESDASFGEIMYQQEQEGKPVQPAERARCFHKAKGFFAVMIGVSPFVLFTLIFALTAKPSLYTLGALPGWVQQLTRQNEFGDALGYYAAGQGIALMDICRIAVRAMIMPFINVAVLISDNAAWWAERLSPLLVCIAPLGYGFGYAGGLKARSKIHTGILIGDTRKKKKERKERQRRQRSHSPERLI